MKIEFEKSYEYNTLLSGIDVPVKLSSGGKFAEFRAKLDTGSSHCIFARELGEKLGFTVEDGDSLQFGTAAGSFSAFGHEVLIEVLGIETYSMVYFAADEYFSRNVLGRQGWLNRVKLGLIDYERKTIFERLRRRMENLNISEEFYNSPFLRACRRESVHHTPIWLMRQAGRYQPSYRELREKVSFLELCKTPELATKVTVQAVEQFGFDAAIIFSDILVILEPMGAQLEYVGGSKPKIHNPVRTKQEIDNLREFESVEELNYVYEALRQTRRALPSDVPLIGFVGAPFTLTSYLVEGSGSKNFIETKKLMYSDAGAWHELMKKLSRALVKHLNAQAKAVAQALQIFDSWVGCLSPEDYREFVLHHTKFVVENVTEGVPVIHFGTGTATLLKLMREAGGDVIGVDWHSNLGEAWQKIGFDKALQGNLDPAALFAPREVLLNKVQKILHQAENRPGHIFNLGHGILPETPIDNVKALVDFVHETTTRQ